MRNFLVFFGHLIFFFSAFAEPVNLTTGIAASLDRFDQFYSQNSCVRPALRASSSCPKVVSEMIRDEGQWRSGMIIFRYHPYAKNCESSYSETHKTVNGGLAQNPYAAYAQFSKKDFAYLGEYTNATAKACLGGDSQLGVELLSKFYHHAARLDAAARKNIQERVYISRLLKTKEPDCPNTDYTQSAYQVCQIAKNCKEPTSFEQVVQKAQVDEELYLLIQEKIKQFSEKCEEEAQTCKQVVYQLNMLGIGLVEMNPWFANQKFKETKNRLNMKDRISNFLKLADENLKSQEAQLAEAAACLHGERGRNCDIDQMRETLDSTPMFNTDFSNDRNENFVTHMMTVQACKEEATLERNRPSSEQNKEAVVASVEMVAGFLTGGLATVAERALLSGVSKAHKVSSLRTLAAVTAYQAVDVGLEAKKIWDGCGQKLKTNFKNLDEDSICRKDGGAVSPVDYEHGSCLAQSVITGIASSSLLIASPKLFKLARSAGYLKPVASTVQQTGELAQAAARETTAASRSTMAAGELTPSSAKIPQRRQSDLAQPRDQRAPVRDRPVRDIGAAAQSGSQIRYAEVTYKPVSELPKSVPNLPPGVQLKTEIRLDGTEKLQYHFIQQLADGTQVIAKRDLPIDPLTGAVNAGFSNGMEFMTKVAEAKAGKAFMAFLDVGKLGKVNKGFKAGEEAGDQYLKAVGEAILKNSQGKITFARPGGDEFVLIIDEVDPKKVQEILTKIQKDIRDVKGDAHAVFKAERLARKEQFQQLIEESAARFRESGALPDEALRMAREEVARSGRAPLDEIARYSQPDVSVGSVELGHGETLASMQKRAEAQAAQEMKIPTTLENGLPATKYKNESLPRVRPNPNFLAKVPQPLRSNGTAQTSELAKPSSTNFSGLRGVKEDRLGGLKSFSQYSIGSYKDETGRTFEKLEKFVVDPKTGQRVAVTTEIPRHSSTNMWDGMYPESELVILTNLRENVDTMLVMPKVSNLRYLNYFREGTAAGDEVLAAVADVIRKNMRPTDMSFKLPGADFLWSLDHLMPAQLARLYPQIIEQAKKHPRVLAVIEKERAAILNEIKAERASGAKNSKKIKELTEQLESLKNFDLGIKFQTLSKAEAKSATGVKDIRKMFDRKFDSQE